LYDGIADWYVRTFYTDLSDEDWLGLFEEIVPGGSVIVDVGCGPGQYARRFRENGRAVVSVDLAERMLAVGRRFDPQLIPVVADIGEMPFKVGTIGGVLAAYTLEHVRRDETPAVFRGIADALSPGGALGLMVKCGQGAYEFHSSLVPGARGYVQLWDLDELSEELGHFGFEAVFMDKKAPVSPEEFNHERGFLLARRCSD